VTRLVLLVYFLTLWTASAQFPPPPPAEPPPPAVKETPPPEEDESQKPKDYAFNPLQAVKECKVGDYYFKKRNYQAALKRYQEAEKWNPKYPDAYLKEAEALEKLKDQKKAREAYAKYLELAPDAKDAAQVKRKLAKHS
jgi:tetratricopeptide (TPR) repeat protein